jgi:2-polyprenyl-3-methyl-5-hydroxy-6-metoxy-1,4-benzoquinol methylase
MSWEEIVLILAILLIVVNIFKKPKINEGFKLRHVEKNNDNLYDNFYSEIYDHLAFSDIRNDFEVGEIINHTQPTQHSIILDIGCGTGNIVNRFKQKGFNIYGVDQSQDMINMSMKKYSLNTIIKGNVMQPHLFIYHSFTHIFCLYFTIYYFKNKTAFFENVYDWLKPGGIFILHLVNRDKFSAVLPMNTYKRKDPNTKITKIPNIPNDLQYLNIAGNNFTDYDIKYFDLNIYYFQC